MCLTLAKPWEKSDRFHPAKAGPTAGPVYEGETGMQKATTWQTSNQNQIRSFELREGARQLATSGMFSFCKAFVAQTNQGKGWRLWFWRCKAKAKQAVLYPVRPALTADGRHFFYISPASSPTQLLRCEQTGWNKNEMKRIEFHWAKSLDII